MRPRFEGLAVWLAVVIALAVPVVAQQAQQPPVPRLPRNVIDALPPTARVAGDPGKMVIQSQACRTLPVADARRRIVDLALQEWGFFGFPIVESIQRKRETPSHADVAGAAAGSAHQRLRERQRPSAATGR